jgi:hypothetical protein
VSPLLAIALTMVAKRLNAIDLDRVREINDAATAAGGVA